MGNPSSSPKWREMQRFFPNLVGDVSFSLKRDAWSILKSKLNFY